MKINTRTIKPKLLTISMVIMLFCVTNTQAANYNVSSLANTGTGTLRQAITNANSTAGTHTINFTISGTVNLTSALPNINRSMTFNAHASGNTINRSSTSSFRLLTINSVQTVEVNGFNFTNGATASGTGGGAIWGSAFLTINNCAFSNNYTHRYGGAVNVYPGGSLSLSNSTFISNSTDTTQNQGQAGAVMCWGPTSITNCTFSDNEAGTFGTLWVNDITSSNTSFITNCTVINNRSSFN